ncbi:MAG: DUF4922 domain-containing protein [Melioribacteraceae bacterium]|nr:DUF4922 domain-containing protein [Melioribacteraceae bacterium]
MQDKFIPLENYLKYSGNWLDEFFTDQKKKWNLLSKNTVVLRSQDEKHVKIGKNNFIISHNPNRTASTMAQVDEKSVGARKCFLCENNLYPEQTGVLLDDYIILCNPFPITEMHFTIANKRHIPQKFNIKDFISLIKIFPEEHAVFYNGPKCGASAPDHLHFQSVPKSKLMLIEFADNLEKSLEQIEIVTDAFPNFIFVESKSAAIAEKSITELIKSVKKYFQLETEPMINVLGWKNKNRYKLILILRKKHRPDIFFDEKKGMKISPASADLAGLIVTIDADDFNRANLNSTKQIIEEVTINGSELTTIMKYYNSKN